MTNLTTQSTYTTLEGKVLDLTQLSDEEAGILKRAVGAFRHNMDWDIFGNRFLGPKSALLKPTNGRVTKEVWESPLFQAISDMDDRLGARQGHVLHNGDGDTRDPFSDTWVPSAQAARDKGVTLPGLHDAIRKGVLVVRPIHAEGTRIEVSVNSLRAWTPRHRQVGATSV